MPEKPMAGAGTPTNVDTTTDLDQEIRTRITEDDDRTLDRARQAVEDTYQARRWARYWARHYDFDVEATARSMAEVDRLDHIGRRASEISFAEARAYARAHGSRCHCHGPEQRGVA